MLIFLIPSVIVWQGIEPGFQRFEYATQSTSIIAKHYTNWNDVVIYSAFQRLPKSGQCQHRVADNLIIVQMFFPDSMEFPYYVEGLSIKIGT